MKKKALKAAFPHTLPLFVGFFVIGISFGLLMRSQGFSIILPIFMSVVIFAGSMQFVTVGLLTAGFDPLSAFVLTIMVNARHIFYGISMLEKFRGTGIKKAFLIYGMCDETFSMNCALNAPNDIDKGWFMFFITLLNNFYWVLGTAAGAVLGEVLIFNTKGIDFIMTSLFLTIFIDQWQETKDHTPALIGLISAIISLLIFGSRNFMLPAMAAIVVLISVYASYNDTAEAETAEETAGAK
ncbi:MAG: branched-chain amino acid transporter AzlC [Ruminococcaceae bacterium]|nr:branched-chain amino acid transporter AzlC [Oscillospiraceae bacterium]